MAAYPTRTRHAAKMVTETPSSFRPRRSSSQLLAFDEGSGDNPQRATSCVPCDNLDGGFRCQAAFVHPQIMIYLVGGVANNAYSDLLGIFDLLRACGDWIAQK
jgi:hypothetical protein